MNELQAAYYNSCASQTSHIVEVPAGLFAVVCEGIAYCPVTDATLRNPHRSIVSLHGSRRIAEYFARKLRADAERIEDYEINFVVLPKAPRTAAETRRLIADDEIPF